MTQDMVVHPGQEITAARPEGIPALVSQAGEQGLKRFVEFFTVNIRNANTRKVYHRNACQFLDWCAERGVSQLGEIGPTHVAGYIEGLQNLLSAPSIKQHLAAIRMLFDWLVTGQIVSVLARFCCLPLFLVRMVVEPLVLRPRARSTASLRKQMAVGAARATHTNIDLLIP